VNTPPARPKLEGDEEGIFIILQIVAGVVAWVIIASIVGDRMLGETLGSFGMWAAMFPFARRTWAANLPVWRYWAVAVTAPLAGAALRLLLR
jgi:hypothetical protein